MPSTRTSGARESLLSELMPRIQNWEPSPGSPERCTDTTPATWPARLVLSCEVGSLRSLTLGEEIAPTILSFFCRPKATTTTSPICWADSTSSKSMTVLLPITRSCWS